MCSPMIFQIATTSGSDVSIAKPRDRHTPPDGAMTGLPIPPMEMRVIVGPTDTRAFDNPEGSLVYPYVAAEKYESVFDFGCGCGRVARRLIQQRVPPDRYVGVDLHKGMIDWAQNNLAPVARGFSNFSP